MIRPIGGSPPLPQEFNNLNPPNTKAWAKALESALALWHESANTNADARRLLNTVGFVQGQINLYPNNTQLQSISADLTKVFQSYDPGNFVNIDDDLIKKVAGDLQDMK